MTHFEEVIKQIHAMGGCGVIAVTIDEQTGFPIMQVSQKHGDEGRKFYVAEGYVTACDEEQSWEDAVYYSAMPDSDKARLLHMNADS